MDKDELKTITFIILGAIGAALIGSLGSSALNMQLELAKLELEQHVIRNDTVKLELEALRIMQGQ